MFAKQENRQAHSPSKRAFLATSLQSLSDWQQGLLLFADIFLQAKNEENLVLIGNKQAA